MIKFGTGGWRAVIGDEFTRDNIQRLSKALADKMKDEGVEEQGIAIGYDRRFLSKESAIWASEVFAAEDIPVKFILGSAPTPLIMYFVMKYNLPYGMMITASHNPAVYNGIKVFTRGGRDADEIQTREMEQYIKALEERIREYACDCGLNAACVTGENKPVAIMEYVKGLETGIIEEIQPLNDYLDNIISAVDMQAIRDSGLRVAIDPMYGVSNTSLRTILSTARCDVQVIHEEHDTLFGGKLPAPSAFTLRSLQNYVADRKCDIGIATDGDADRVGVIDDTGRFLHPNDILVMLYYYLVKYKGWKGAVVRNIATTHMLDKVAKGFGETCYEVPVGFKYISSKMNETGAIIGGESSGGLTVRGHINGKDGIYASTLLVEMIAKTGKKMSEIAKEIEEEYGAIYMEERDYKFSQEKKEIIAHTLLEEKLLPQLPADVEKVSYLDGCKVYFKDGGWIIARFSGTEPLLRIFCEMPDKNMAAKMCQCFEEFLDLTYTGN